MPAKKNGSPSDRPNHRLTTGLLVRSGSTNIFARTMQRPPWSLSLPTVTLAAASQDLQWPLWVLRTLVRKPGRVGFYAACSIGGGRVGQELDCLGEIGDHTVVVIEAGVERGAVDVALRRLGLEPHGGVEIHRRPLDVAAHRVEHTAIVEGLAELGRGQ